MNTNIQSIINNRAGALQPTFRVSVYARTSTITQAEEEKISIPDQIQWAERICKERGWEFVDSYVDTLPGDIEFEQRPQGYKLLEDARSKQFDLLLFYHSSRLAREPWVGLKTISILGKNGIQVYIRNAPIEPIPPASYIYGANVASEYLNALSLVGDKQENIARGERVTSGFKNLAQRGVLVFAPYGYTKCPKIEFASDGRQMYSWTFEINPSHSIIVKRIFKEYNLGKSLRKIVKDLIQDRIPSPSGKTGPGSWSPATIRNILSNTTYICKIRWGKKLGSKYRQGRSETGKQKRIIASSDKWLESNSSNCPRIIETPLFMKTQELLKQRGRITGRQLASTSLLPGLVYCGDCRLRAFSKSRTVHKNGKAYFRTDFIDQSYTRGLDCRRHLMSAEKLERLVLLQLQSRLERLNKADLEKLITTNNVSSKYEINESVRQIKKQLKTFELKKTRLLDIFLSGSITKNEFQGQKEKLDNEEALLIQEQNRLIGLVNDEKKNINALQTLKQLLNMFTITTDLRIRKEMLHRIIETVVIYQDRVEIIYKYTSGALSETNDKPHPCGYLGDKHHECTCAPGQILRYQKKVSGPLLDRIDIHIDVPAVKVQKLTEEDKDVEDSARIRKRVQKARDLQLKRYKGSKIASNSELNNKNIKVYCVLSEECLQLLRLAVAKMHLSGRSYYRTIKLARTIADLENVDNIAPNHIAEALQYRPKVENSVF